MAKQTIGLVVFYCFDNDLTFKKELSKINRKVVNSGDMFSLKDSAHMLEKLLDTSGNYLGLAPNYDINAIEKLLNIRQFDKNKLVKINTIKLARA